MDTSGLSGIVGIGAGLASMFGGGNPYSAPSFYQPTGLGAADISWQQQLQQQQGIQQQIDPTLLAAYLNQAGMNYAPIAQAGQMAGAQYGGLAGAQTGAGAQMLGAGNQVLQTAMDPQQALFAQQQQLVQDQARAANAATGLGMSPYGAGNEATALTNFDINWQNQQLARQQQGIGAAGQAYGQGLGYAGEAPVSTMAAGTVPIQAQQQAYQGPAQAAQQYAQTAMPMAQSIQNQIMPYLGYGTGAAGAQYGAYAGQQAMQNQQQAAGLGAFLSGLSQFGGSPGLPSGVSYNPSTGGYMGP